MARFVLKIWQCDEFSGRRSINFLADNLINCSAENGIFDKCQPLLPKNPALGWPLPSKSTLPTEGIFSKDFIANGWRDGAGIKLFDINFFSRSIAGRIILWHLYISLLEMSLLAEE